MATPANSTYSAASGATLYCGRAAPSAALPAWLAGQPLNTWIEIPNTSGAGGAHIDSFGGLAQRGTELWSHLVSGHGDGHDNRSAMIDIGLDNPASQGVNGWVIRRAASTSVQDNVSYYPDGTPAARHTYSSLHWCAQRNRFMVFTLWGYYTNGNSAPVVDGFNPDTNTWDAAGTWPDMTGGYTGAVSCPNGNVWGTGGFTAKRWNQATNDYTVFSLAQYVRTPICYDSLRGHLFNLQFGDGNGNNPELGMLACKINEATGAQTIITFNASAGKTAFQSEPTVGTNAAPLMYSGMDYEPNIDKYLFYCGMSNAGRVYAATPSNISNVWDIAIHPTTGTVPATPASGLNNRFKYVAALKGFVLAPSQSSNLFFLRTA